MDADEEIGGPEPLPGPETVTELLPATGNGADRGGEPRGVAEGDGEDDGDGGDGGDGVRVAMGTPLAAEGEVEMTEVEERSVEGGAEERDVAAVTWGTETVKVVGEGEEEGTMEVYGKVRLTLGKAVVERK